MPILLMFIILEHKIFKLNPNYAPRRVRLLKFAVLKLKVYSCVNSIVVHPVLVDLWIFPKSSEWHTRVSVSPACIWNNRRGAQYIHNNGTVNHWPFSDVSITVVILPSILLLYTLYYFWHCTRVFQPYIMETHVGWWCQRDTRVRDRSRRGKKNKHHKIFENRIFTRDEEKKIILWVCRRYVMLYTGSVKSQTTADLWPLRAGIMAKGLLLGSFEIEFTEAYTHKYNQNIYVYR